MKAIVSVLLCLMVILAACKKNNEVKNTLSLKGTWELRATKGGNIIPATYAPGNGHLISFNNSTFATYTSGVLETSGSYQQHSDNLGHDTLILNSTNPTSGSLKNLVTIQNDTLKIVPLFPDVATSLYVYISAVVYP